MILVVGATGMVGSTICARLLEEGFPVRALVRSGSAPEKVMALEEAGASVLRGDLRDRASLERACSGVQTVITTVSAMPFSYVPGENDIQSVDLEGQMHLIEAAASSGIRHFTYMSFSGNLDVACPLHDAKRAVEKALVASGLEYTILRPSCFMEVWLSPAVGFDFPNAQATIYGDGTKPISWIAVKDVAEFAVQSVERPAAANAILELGGPEALSALDAVSVFERVARRPFGRQFVPVEALRAQLDAATDPMAQSFSALMLDVAGGDPIDMSDALGRCPIQLTSVETYAEKVLEKVPGLV